MAGRGKPQADSFPVEVHDDSPGPRGRWLRSSRDIRPGEVVLRCLPLSVAVADDQVERRCASCLRHLAEGEAQTVCEKRERHGCGVRLCAACSACERWQQIHRHGDCQSIRMAQDHSSAATGSGQTTSLRLLAQLQHVRVLEARGELAPFRPDWCDGDAAFSDTFEDSCALLSHFDELSDEQALAMLQLAAAAKLSNDALAEQASMLSCNAFELTDSVTGLPIGEGLYPSVAACMNHSCRPNCDFQLGPGGALVVRALQAVRRGGELTIAYCNCFTANRRAYLRKAYFFDCECPRCVPTEQALPEVPVLMKRMREAWESRDAPEALRAAERVARLTEPLIKKGEFWAEATLRWAHSMSASCTSSLPGGGLSALHRGAGPQGTNKRKSSGGGGGAGSSGECEARMGCAGAGGGGGADDGRRGGGKTQTPRPAAAEQQGRIRRRREDKK